MGKKVFTAILTLIICQTACLAQLNSSGEDPGRIRWSYIQSDNFKIIYPQGSDSLALTYGRLLEKYRLPAAASTGLVPKSIPVVLHTENASANISAQIAPRRLEISVRPQGYNTFSHPINEISSLYAARLASQSEFGFTNALRPFTWFLGEMSAGGASMFYPDKWMKKGDAVLTTTALTQGGFGRYGDFLNYYMASFCEGDTRDNKWDRWMIGSFKNYTPGHDAFGYLVISGLRNLYDNPFYIRDFYSYYSRRPYDIFVGVVTDKRFTGGRTKKHIFPEIIDFHTKIWQKEIEDRKPFNFSENILTSSQKKFADYKNTVADSLGNIYTVKTSLEHGAILLKISPQGEEKKITYFDQETSPLSYSFTENRLYWSEKETDLRWKQKIYNTLYYYDLETKCKKKLTKEKNVYNPSVSPDGRKIAAIRGDADGQTSLVIIDAGNGNTIAVIPSPHQKLSLSETAFGHSAVFCVGVSEKGTGIYCFPLSSNTLSNNEKPQWKECTMVENNTVRNLFQKGNSLYFSCDISGVFDLYSLDLDTKEIFRHTSEKYGTRNFGFFPDGNSIFYSRMTKNGYELRKCPADSLFRISTHLSNADKANIVLTKKIAEQEQHLMEGHEILHTEFSQPQPYSKAENLFHIHSWAPVYFDSDNIKNLSGEHVYDLISIGATILTQNTLSTACGSAGYSWHPDPDGSGWVHGGHIKFRYSGWYPVIEGSLRVNDKVAYQYHIDRNKNINKIKRNVPSVTGQIKLYLPLSRENGGHSYGFIPMGTWELNNDLIDGILNHNFTLTTRLWWLKDKAKSEIFPRFGAGMSTGFKLVAIPSNKSIRMKLNNTWQAYFYGYLPGILPCQGLKLTLLYQTKLNRGIYNPISDILPRGLDNTFLENMTTPERAAKFTADYVIPINTGDINITPFLYLNRILLTPHFDMMISSGPHETLYSAGASLTLQLGRLIWAFAPFKVGIDYSFNGGSAMNKIESSGMKCPRHFIGPVFKIEL